MTWGQHVLSMLYDVTLFQHLLLHFPKSCDQSCDFAIKLWLMWQRDWSPLTQVDLKIENKRRKKEKRKRKIKWKGKMKSTINDLDTRGKSLQDGLWVVWTCGTTLASAYMLHHLFAAWSQLQMIGRSPKGEWVLIWCVAVEH